MDKKEHFKILLVEDNKDFREGTGASLSWTFKKYNEEKHPVYVDPNIVMVASAEDALHAICLDADIKLIITDLKFPSNKMDGLTLVTLVSNLQLDKRIGCIVQTGYPDQESLKKSMHFGVFEYLEKPFPVEVLIEAVKEYIRLRYRKFTLRVDEREIFNKEKDTTHGPYTYVTYLTEDGERKCFSLGLSKDVGKTVLSADNLPEEESPGKTLVFKAEGRGQRAEGGKRKKESKGKV